jgi:hypothetical protein
MQVTSSEKILSADSYNASTCKETTLFSGHYLRNRSTLDIGVLGYISILYPKEHPLEVWHIPPGTTCINGGGGYTLHRESNPRLSHLQRNGSTNDATACLPPPSACISRNHCVLERNIELWGQMCWNQEDWGSHGCDYEEYFVECDVTPCNVVHDVVKLIVPFLNDAVSA